MRAFAYVRVSEARDGMISPGIQRDEITRYAERKGWTVTRWFEDLDLSGRSMTGRTGLEELLSEALAGNCEVVLFYRIDRLSREEADFHAIVAALRRAGIHVDSPGNPNDGSPESALLWSISAALAKYESVRLGQRISDSHRRLRASGRYHGGVLPYGFRRRPDGPGLVADPAEATWVLQVHEWYQAGRSFRWLARELNARGVPSKQGGQWSLTTVRQLLTSPYQVGGRETEYGIQTGGNVEAIVPREVFDRTQALIEARRHLTPYRGRPSQRSPLANGLVRCGNCGNGLALRYHAKRGPGFSCFSVAQGRCERGVYILAATLEGTVEERLFERLRHARAPERPRKPLGDVGLLRDAAEAASAALARLAAAYAEGELTREEFHAARDRLRGKRDDAERRLAQAAARVEDDVQADAAQAMWTELGQVTREVWQALSVEDTRAIYGLVVRRVVVHSADAPARVRVEWRV